MVGVQVSVPASGTVTQVSAGSFLVTEVHLLCVSSRCELQGVKGCCFTNLFYAPAILVSYVERAMLMPRWVDPGSSSGGRWPPTAIRRV